MFKLIIGLLSGPQKILWLLVIAGTIFGVGSVSGWKARDFFADRKEEKRLEQALKDERKKTSDLERRVAGFQSDVARQQSDAAKKEAEREASRQRANKLSAQVFQLKELLTRMEKASVNEAGEFVCERTDPCHWLLINAATQGTAVPDQCTSIVPEKVRDKFMPDAALDREGN